MIGPFPAFAECLRALGINYAYLIEQDLRQNGYCGIKGNPWRAFSELMDGAIGIHGAVYASELPHYKATWASISADCKRMLELLSRFEISQEIVTKWYNDENSYLKVISNPYLISENSNFNDSLYVTTEIIDLGVISDSEIQGDWLPESPYKIETKIDERRIRALIVYKLKCQLVDGDTLLSINELTDFVESKLELDDIQLPKNYIVNKRLYLEEILEFIDNDATQTSALQLKEYFKIEKFLRAKFRARAAKCVKIPINEDWEGIVLPSLR